MTLQEAFEQVEDHRSGPAQRYDLKEMIIMAICAVLCGADSWVDVADWCEEEEGWLRSFLVVANGTPSHDREAWPRAIRSAKYFECWTARYLSNAFDDG